MWCLNWVNKPACFILQHTYIVSTSSLQFNIEMLDLILHQSSPEPGRSAVFVDFLVGTEIGRNKKLGMWPRPSLCPPVRSGAQCVATWWWVGSAALVCWVSGVAIWPGVGLAALVCWVSGVATWPGVGSAALVCYVVTSRTMRRRTAEKSAW